MKVCKKLALGLVLASASIMVTPFIVQAETHVSGGVGYHGVGYYRGVDTMREGPLYWGLLVNILTILQRVIKLQMRLRHWVMCNHKWKNLAMNRTITLVNLKMVIVSYHQKDNL